jgi:hypothetical protein
MQECGAQSGGFHPCRPHFGDHGECLNANGLSADDALQEFPHVFVMLSMIVLVLELISQR